MSGTCLMTVLRNRYLVPCEVAGHMVSTRLYPSRVAVVADDKIVASHTRLSDHGPTSYDGQHYIPLVQRKPGVLVAATLVLETGAVSAEHVLNVLGRLKVKVRSARTVLRELGVRPLRPLRQGTYGNEVAFTQESSGSPAIWPSPRCFPPATSVATRRSPFDGG